MGAVVHSNVGLMHATMAIFNAWCDRVPMLVLGATGPGDADQAPAVDRLDPHRAPTRARWCATTPSGTTSPAPRCRGVEALLRAHQIANTAPRGPVYVNLDAAMQEAKIARAAASRRCGAFRCRRAGARPPPALIEAAARPLAGAKHPVILAGRVSRAAANGWSERVALAEATQRRSSPTSRSARLSHRSSAAAAPPATGLCARSGRSRCAKPTWCSRSTGSISPARCKAAWGGGTRGRRNHPGLRRRAPAPRLEHGLPGPAAGRRLHAVRTPDVAVPLLLERSAAQGRRSRARRNDAAVSAGDRRSADPVARSPMR